MKKKLITIVIGAMLCAGLFAGCGQSDTKQDKAAGTESAKQADTKDEGEKGSQEEKELTGTIDDIKDFMFVVTDDKIHHTALPSMRSLTDSRVLQAEIR